MIDDINLQRACEQCIDLANHVVRTKKLGLPKESREGFRLMAQENLIPDELADILCNMVGFRNTLIHEYHQIDISIMKTVIHQHLDDLIRFADSVLQIAD